MYEFKFPDVGEGITEGEIVQWLVKDGEEVKEHQPVLKVETAKAIVDIPSPVAGKIRILCKEGEVVRVGQVIFTIDEKFPAEKPVMKPAGAVGYLEEAPETVEEKEEASKMPCCPICKACFLSEEKLKAHVETHKIAARKKVLAAPAVRKLAQDLGIDLEQVIGTGKNGRITEEDVRKYAAQVSAIKAEEPLAVRVQRKYDKYGYIERIPLKGVRKVIAQRMAKSAFTIPHVTHMDEADLTKLWHLRELKKKVAARKGIHLTFLPFIVKACVLALKEHPLFNAMLDEEHGEIIVKKYYNIGIAVDTEDGLIVPVIKGADQKNIFQIAKEIFELAEKARQRKIDLADLQGGTFTITNIGSLGGYYATPIINYPEIAILAVGRIFERLVAKGHKVVFKKILPLSLAFDHRVNDGADAAKFMNAVKISLENPEQLLDSD